MRDFFEVLDSLSDMEMALSMYYAAGNAITKGETTPTPSGHFVARQFSQKETSLVRQMIR